MDLDTKQIIKENYPPDFGTNNFSESLIESTYFDIGEYKYWTMGEPIEITTILNRALLKNTPAVIPETTK